MGGIGLLLSYPAVTHYAVATGRPTVALMAVTALGLLAVIGLVPRLLARLVVGLAVIPFIWLGPLSAHWVVLLPPIAINLALAWWFGRTLIDDREPLITRFARLESGEGRLDGRRLAYTRRLTWVWTLFFVAIAAASTLLAVTTSEVAWSWFANGASYGLALSLFLGEHLFRRMRFPGYTFASPLEQLRILVRSSLLGPREPV